MYKLIVCVVLTCALVATAYGECPDPRHQLVIGDWEENMDGWTTWGSATASYSGVGVTLNEWSLETRTSPGWQQDIGFSFPGAGLLDAFFSHQYFCIDITRLADEWTRDADPNVDHWSGLKLIINSGPTDANVPTAGWHSLEDDNSWWSSTEGDVTLEACWDYSAERDALAPYKDNIGWLEFVLVTNTGGYTAIGPYYLDNAVLCGVPEPTTIALLGLGGLALLRRKRV